MRLDSLQYSSNIRLFKNTVLQAASHWRQKQAQVSFWRQKSWEARTALLTSSSLWLWQVAQLCISALSASCCRAVELWGPIEPFSYASIALFMFKTLLTVALSSQKIQQHSVTIWRLSPWTSFFKSLFQTLFYLCQAVQRWVTSFEALRDALRFWKPWSWDAVDPTRIQQRWEL